MFGKDQIAIFRVSSNDNIIVAARDLFSSSQSISACDSDNETCVNNDFGTIRHPCEDYFKFIDHMKYFSEYHYFNDRVTSSNLISLDCNGYSFNNWKYFL